MKLLKIILYLLIMTNFLNCSTEPAPRNAFSSEDTDLFYMYKGKQPDEITINVKMQETKLGKIQNELYAKVIKRYYDLDFFIADSVRILSYNEKGEFVYSLDCDSAFVDQKTNLFTAMGNVFVVNSDGDLKTNILKWDRDLDELIAPEAVILNHENNTIKGNYLETNIDFDYIRLKKVSAKGKIDESNIVN